MMSTPTAVGDTPTSHLLPLAELSSYPSFLSSPSPVEGIATVEEIAALPLRSLERFDAAHRRRLVEAILADLEHWGAPAAAREAAERLRQEGVGAAITGQQAGIGTGPLYTLLKATGALRAAEELEAVPIFWIEGDDQDFEEARSIGMLDRQGERRLLRYDDGDPRPLHVGDRVVSREGFEALLSEMADALPEGERSVEALELLRTAYLDRPGRTLGDGFARTLYALLGETPLVVVSSRNPELKRLAAEVYAGDARDPDQLVRGLERPSQLPHPIDPKPGGLFVTVEGERRSLQVDGEGYMIRGEETKLGRDEAERLARNEPERMSPNVALRPIAQDAALPTLLYLGGPSEIAYLAQVRPAYDAFDIEPAAVAPRPFALLLEPKVRRIIEQTGVSLEELLDPAFDPQRRAIDPEVERRLEEAEGRVASSLEAAWRELTDVVEEIDPSLSKTRGAAEAAGRKELENLGRKLRQALRRREQTTIDRMAAARDMVAPGGKPQERAYTPINFVARYGLAALRQALEGLELRPGSLQVIEL